MKAIQQKLYKRVSAEFLVNLKRGGKVHKYALSAVALLGATAPAVTNLADLVAYFTKQISPNDSGDSFERLITFEAVDEPITSEETHKQEDDMSEDAIKDLESRLTAKFESDIKAKDTALEQAETKLKEFEAKDKAREQEAYEAGRKATTDEIRVYCEEAVKAGTMTPAASEALNVTDVLKFSTDEGATLNWDAVKKFHEALALAFEFTEKGSSEKGEKEETYDTVGDEVDAKTRKYMADNKDVDYTTAMNTVLDADTELADKYAKGGTE
jgi:hypothetical protein